MAWPLTPLTTYIPNSLPRIKADDLNKLQAAINSMLTNLYTFKAVQADGTGGAVPSTAAGNVEASAAVIAGTSMSSGAGMTAGTFIAANTVYGKGGVPTRVINAVATTGAGTGATSAIVGNDPGHLLDVTTGTTAGAGLWATVTFHTPVGPNRPVISVTPNNDAARQLSWYIFAVLTTGQYRSYELHVDTGLSTIADATTYQWAMTMVGAS